MEQGAGPRRYVVRIRKKGATSPGWIQPTPCQNMWFSNQSEDWISATSVDKQLSTVVLGKAKLRAKLRNKHLVVPTIFILCT